MTELTQKERNNAYEQSIKILQKQPNWKKLTRFERRKKLIKTRKVFRIQ